MVWIFELHCSSKWRGLKKNKKNSRLCLEKGEITLEWLEAQLLTCIYSQSIVVQLNFGERQQQRCWCFGIKWWQCHWMSRISVETHFLATVIVCHFCSMKVTFPLSAHAQLLPKFSCMHAWTTSFAEKLWMTLKIITDDPIISLWSLWWKEGHPWSSWRWSNIHYLDQLLQWHPRLG